MNETSIHRILGCLSLVLSVALYLLLPGQVSVEPIPGAGDLVWITPATVPLACAMAFALIGVLFIGGSFLSALQKERPVTKLIEREALPKLAFTIITLLAYVFLMEFLGYLLATILFLLTLNLYFGTRGAKQLGVAAILVPAAIFLFFARVMLIPLPEGILGN